MESALPIPNPVLEPELLQCIQRGSDLHSLKSLDIPAWQALLQQANDCRLLPFLYQRLVRERSGQTLLPSKVEQQLRTAYYQSLAENTRTYHLLGQVLQRLQAAGLRILLLKGAYLAEQVYADIGLRPMGDLDLLSPQSEFQRALAILNGMGFTSERPYSKEADGALHFHAPALSKDGVEIELHWNLVASSSPVHIDIQRMWDHALPVTLENGRAWALAPEDLLLYLCVHAAYGHEFYGQLRSLVDIMQVMHHPAHAIEWDRFTQTATEWLAGRGVYLTMNLAKELLNVDFPAEKLETLKPADWTPQALVWAKENLLRVGQDLNLNPKFIRVMSANLPPRQRFLALLHGFFPSRKAMTRLYGFPPDSWQTTIRYPSHAASRIPRYWVYFMRRLRGDPSQERGAQNTLALRLWLGIKD